MLRFRFERFHSFRWVVCFSVWFALLALCILRAVFGVAVIGMIKSSPKVNDEARRCVKSSSTVTCPAPYNNTNKDVIDGTQRQKWSSAQTEVSIFTFNLGYMVGHYPGTIITLLLGTHRTMMLVIFGSTALTFVSIYVVEYYAGFILIRIAIGIITGCMFPIVNETTAEYAPAKERSIILMFIHTANLLACAIIFPTGGYFILNYPNGWWHTFMISCLFGLVSGVLWVAFCYPTPTENPYMSKSEQDYITLTVYPKGRPPRKQWSNIPHRRIWMDKQLWIHALVHYGKLQILYSTLLGVVKYFFRFYSLSSLQAGLYGVIPFVGESVFQISYGHLAVHIFKGRMSVRNQRRFNTLLGAFGCSIFLFFAFFVDCQHLAAGVALQTMSLIFLAPYQCGYFLGIVERYGRFNGYAYSIINIFGSMSGMLQRVMLIILNTIFCDDRHALQWSFVLTSLMSFAACIPYLIWGDSTRPPWVDDISNQPIIIVQQDDGFQDDRAQDGGLQDVQNQNPKASLLEAEVST